MHPFVGSQPFNASCAAFIAVEFSLSGIFICPSETAVNAPGWYITPAIVFGNSLCFTLFKITAPTATCPS